MKLPKDEFVRLQQHWYQKLAELGFKDIERVQGDDYILLQTASDCYRNSDEFSRRLKEDYFRCMAQAALDEATIFKSEIDRHIMVRYAEGAKIKVIVHELREMGLVRNRDSVRFIIRRYEMAWGFRHYSCKQLRIKRA